MSFRLAFLLLISWGFYPFTFLFCLADFQEDPSPIASFESVPSSVVGKVNVITGTYQEFSQDIVIPGPEPLVIQRAYNSLNTDMGSLKRGWNFNHGGYFELDRREDSHSELKGPFGSLMIFASKRSPKNGFRGLTFDLDKMLDGLTNCAEGMISGRTNKKNYLMICDDKNKECWLQMGSGSKRYYRPRKKDLEKSYYLRSERKPNGNMIAYEYDDDNRIKKIEAKSASGKVFAWAKFIYPSREDFLVNPHIKILTSDGRQVLYNFLKFKHHSEPGDGGGDEIHRHFLSQAIRSDLPPEVYDYDKGDKKSKEALKAKFGPEGRCLMTEYYTKGSHKTGKKWVKVKRDDGVFRRVKRQLAPVGTDSTLIPTHTFYYNLDRNITEVYNAHDHPTFYVYSDDSVLTNIQHMKIKMMGNVPMPIIYRSENFFWGPRDSADQGNLVCRTISQSMYALPGQSLHSSITNIILGCKAYKYDKFGNVICESLWGNLTGVKPKPIQLNAHNYPIENGCHHHDIYYEYSLNGFNLLLKEQHPNGKIVLYSYKPDTELMTSKLILDGSSIILREFYAYNEDAVLIQTIRDDGNTPDPANLNNVTERAMTFIYPKQSAPCLGLPEIVEEQCLDMATGQAILLKKMVNIYDLLGHVIEQYHYDSLGQLAYVLAWQYDDQGHVISETNALGQVIQRRYDANGNLIFEQGPRYDTCKTFTYDFVNRLIRAEEIDGAGVRLANTYRYDLIGNKIASTDLHGNETRFVYDEFNQLIQIISPSVLSETGSLITPTLNYTYDVLGNRITITDARGFITRRECNVRGQPTASYYPDGTEEHFEYTTAGKLIKSIDRKGLMTTYEYDVLDRITQTNQYANGQLLSSRSSLYSTFHLMQEIDELGQLTNYFYDAAGRLNAKRTPTQFIIYGYDSLGRQAYIQESVNSTDYLKKNQTYDLIGQVIEETLIDQAGVVHHRTSYEYLPDGQQTAITTYSQKGAATTRTLYNSLKQPLTIIDAEGNKTVTVYAHDFRNTLGQVVLQTTTTDPLGHNIVTTYDALERVAKIERYGFMGTLLQRKEIFYDGSGNKSRILESAFTPGLPTRYVWTAAFYDCMNRLEHLIECEGSPQAKHTFYSYNAQGEKAGIMKSDGCLILHTYDPIGRLLTFKASDDSFSYAYHYNAKGLPTQIVDLKNGTMTKRVYDSGNRMIQEWLQNGLVLNYQYDGLDRPTRMLLHDGTGAVYHYKGPYLHQVLRMNQFGTILYQHTYEERDLSGNPLLETLPLSAGIWQHKYDRLGRVTDSISNAWQENQFAYNGLGSLVTREFKDIKGIVPCCYQYDELDQLLEEKGNGYHQYWHDSAHNRVVKNGVAYLVNELNQLISHGNTCYLYDRCGNCTCKAKDGEITTYTYDALDRLTSVTQGENVTTYTYDAFNRRVDKAVNGNLTYYIYADQNEIGSIENGGIKDFRLLGTGKGAEIGAAIALEIQQQIYVPLHDYSGNVSCLLDTQGNVVEAYRYSAFGEGEVYDGEGSRLQASINPWRFSSKRHESETGWIYFGRRYYDPETGRWMTPDPLGQEGGPNLYAYVLNNPLTHIDLYGLTEDSGFFKFLFTQLFSWLGTGMMTIGYECVPFPVVKDGITAPGHFLCYGNFNEYTLSWQETH